MVHSHIKVTNESLANQIEIEQAVKHLKMKDFYSSIKIMRCFNKNEAKVRYISATSLYYPYFLERGFNLAGDYADISVKTSRYDAKAIVNKNNCFFINSDFLISK